ncbi:hypothetical protein JOC86_003775 [Bacillus pakistanensis]|uniref:ATP synthase F0 subunit 8 n=1 Tax=Rossellomorea pakistanensis TaxID=992288 RepID=A0ABS2NH86_9BACI|nr:hypothetical protein [Bacillus pakistanensis]MBM7587202.1 hypothetical protein [Bacillus pakistanensis]
MVNGVLILLGLCIFEIILAKLVIKDKDCFMMDFYEFFDLDLETYKKTTKTKS